MSDWGYYSARVAVRLLLRPLVRLHIWRVPGASQTSAGAVLVANHISHFDPFFLAGVIERPIDWMTTEEFYSNPLLAILLRAFNTIPVDRSRPDHRALRQGVHQLRAGRIVGVFPEGGIRAGARSILEGAAPKSGAAALARIANVPVIPCVIFGTDRLYSSRSWRPWLRRTKIWIAVGELFFVSDAKGVAANNRLIDTLRKLSAATIAHFDLQPDDLPATPAHRKGRDAKLRHNEFEE